MAEIFDPPPQFTLLEAVRHIWQGQAHEAIALLEALPQPRAPAVESVRLRYLATTHNLAGQTERAPLLADEARQTAHGAGDAEEQVHANAVLARVRARAGAATEAIALLRECARACEDGLVGDDVFHFGCLVDLAGALSGQSQSRPALATFERAFALAEGFSDRVGLAELYAGMAKTRLDRGDHDGAITYARKSVQIHEEIGLLARIASARAGAAKLDAEHGDDACARSCLERAAS